MFWSKKVSQPITKSFYALGTVNTITVYQFDAEHVIDMAMRKVYEIDDKMSVFKENSEVSQINSFSGIKPVKVSAETFFVISQAVKYSKMTDGAMDITIKPLVELWAAKNRVQQIPTASEINDIKKLVNINDIKLDYEQSTVMMENVGQAIDLGSIAKGFAADQVRKILQSNKIKNAIINLGGNVIVMGKNPQAHNWTVGVQHPEQERGVSIGYLELKDKAVVTSGGYERYTIIGDKKFHHIIDPKTGMSSKSDIKSVTIVANESIVAEGLSTGIFIMGLSKAKELLSQMPSVSAVIITQDDNVYISKNVFNKFTKLDNIFIKNVL